MPHAYQREMSTPSKIFQLPIMFCNEAKYEECLNIMDNYETILEDVYTKAHGGIQTLDQIGCVVGGDQLTRVRLEGAKDLRSLSLTKKDRFEHLQPVVCELWHLKVDFLEKLFKTFYKAQSGSQPGTLAYYRNILRKTGVNGKVKSNFQAHSEFIILVTKELIGQQMEEVLEKHPGIIPSNIKEATLETKKKIMASIMDKFEDKFQNSTQQQNSTDDFLYNYTSQLCQWGLHYLAMDDTAKEGDITRIIPNLKRCIPFFFSHSKLSKYLVECINYIVQYEHSSPMTKLRILEGSFVNRRGGIGKNVEADLVQEHSVRFQKELIRGLGSNKSEAAITRVTSASNLLSAVISNFDSSLNVKQKAPHHTVQTNPEDTRIIRDAMETLKPMKYIPGRSCQFFHFVSPKFYISPSSILPSITTIKKRIEYGLSLADNEEEEDEMVDGLP
ncbi:hypothetical protein FSP39_006061 [Pinctada imbricata]|nr:hypothetical protein FSP39_006061 [Pinctada imbricata]